MWSFKSCWIKRVGYGNVAKIPTYWGATLRHIVRSSCNTWLWILAIWEGAGFEFVYQTPLIDKKNYYREPVQSEKTGNRFRMKTFKEVPLTMNGECKLSFMKCCIFFIKCFYVKRRIINLKPLKMFTVINKYLLQNLWNNRSCFFSPWLQAFKPKIANMPQQAEK